MYLNNDKIMGIIHDYNNNANPTIIKCFQEEIYNYVKTWIKKLYLCDDDLSHDFVLYIIEQTEEIITSYPLSSQVSFFTWFNAVLYHKFCNFTKKSEFKNKNILLKEEMTISTIELSDDLSVEKQLIEQSLDKLNNSEKSIWLFCYAPHQIEAEHIIHLAEYTQKTLQEIILCHQKILKNNYQSYLEKETIAQKIKNIDNKINHLENILKKNSKEEQSNELREKILRYKNRQNKYLRSLKQQSSVVSKHFCTLFKDYDTAYRTIKKINHQIKKLILQKD